MRVSALRLRLTTLSPVDPIVLDSLSTDIRMESIVIFNEHFRPKMTEADVLAMLAMSTEFDQIQVRENEVPELKFMMDEIIPCQVKGGTDTSQGKVNILLQGYVSRFFVEDFALVSDSMYAAQVRPVFSSAASIQVACRPTLFNL